VEWPRYPLPWTHHRRDRSARPGALRAANTTGGGRAPDEAAVHSRTRASRLRPRERRSSGPTRHQRRRHCSGHALQARVLLVVARLLHRRPTLPGGACREPARRSRGLPDAGARAQLAGRPARIPGGGRPGAARSRGRPRRGALFRGPADRDRVPPLPGAAREALGAMGEGRAPAGGGAGALSPGGRRMGRRPDAERPRDQRPLRRGPRRGGAAPRGSARGTTASGTSAARPRPSSGSAWSSRSGARCPARWTLSGMP
jgi:hypothetical protein